jgi:hypothetical protein
MERDELAGVRASPLDGGVFVIRGVEPAQRDRLHPRLREQDERYRKHQPPRFDEHRRLGVELYPQSDDEREVDGHPLPEVDAGRAQNPKM